MLKYIITATAEVYDTADNLPVVIDNAMKSLRKKFENETGNLVAMPNVLGDQSNGGIVTIILRGRDEQ